MRTRFAAVVLVVAALAAIASAQESAPAAPADARPVAELLKDLREGGVPERRKAVFDLWNRGPGMTDGLDAVGAALVDTDDYVADVAARILDRAGPASAVAIDGVDAALGDARPKVRAAAARILWKMGPPSKDAAPSLLPLLDDRDADVRVAVVEALTPMGRYGVEDPEGVVRGLAHALDDVDPRVRQKAALGLVGWGEVGDLARDPLIARLGDSDTEVRRLAANALWAMGRSARKALGRLYELLADPSGRVRACALGAAAAIEPKEPHLFPALLTAAKDPDPEVRCIALGFLGGSFADAPGVAAVVQASVNDPDGRVRQVATGFLFKFGAAAVPALIAALRGGDPLVRFEAAKGCRELGPLAARAAPFLVDSLRGESDQMSVSVVVQALGRVGGPDAADAVPELRRIMARPGYAGLRSACALAVWRLDPARTDEVLRTLTPLLVDPRTAYFAANSLGEMGPAATPAVPDLIRVLDAEPDYVRSGAAEALGRIGAASGAAVPQLETLARDDPSARVRPKAAEALVRIRDALGKDRP